MSNISGLGNKKIFAKNLNYYMKINNIDRNKICKDLDFNYTTVREWTNGTSYPRIDKIEMLANYFGIKKSDLIEEHKNNHDNNDSKLFATTIYKDDTSSIEIKSDKPLSSLSEEEQQMIIQRAMDELYEFKRDLKKKEK